MKTENQWRERIVMHGQSLYQRGLGPGSSGNISVRLEDGLLVTPTNSCLGRLDPDRISKINMQGEHISGDKPSKEAFLHLLMYRQRPQDSAVVHLHSTYSVAASCCSDLDPDNVLPAITAYYTMKIGKLPLIPYFKPGDKALAEAVAKVADKRHAVLLANHGPVVAGKTLDNAVYAMEELEETAKLYFLLQNHKTRFLSPQQIEELLEAFPD
ncbi:3-oxo-tetronate 4-phosphate decarboxylase [Agarilytica rhodophyticola]|uniref:3-oxo-tetronate 4-phosphate decarboxylase n=1 Tax=Agarilytica rhodophyticola TaxID=1737490 RepID=UPI001FE39F9A|nr:3-oxo-tetronate 4-phosphate decarboxylase [Agarilytica rhodophyticola]